MKTRNTNRLYAAMLLAAAGSAASADIRISEYMYSGNGGEFIELINTGCDPVDMTGWSYDDDSRTPGEFDLSAFGVVMPGEIVIISEDASEVFRSDWGLSVDLKIVGELGLENANSLGRNDAIVLFDSMGAIADQLVYGDGDIPGSIRTQDASGWVNAAGVGQDDALAWVLSTAGDAQSSALNLEGVPGNPGMFTAVGGAVPAGVSPMVITEYMYSGDPGEFVEFTNVSASPVDMTGWAYDDNNFGAGAIGAFDLSAFGTVMPGESVIITDADAEVFRTSWGLGASVKIIGDVGAGNGGNIGRNDEINIYDAADNLVDRLTYGDENFPGSFRANAISASTTPEFLGANDILQWAQATPSDELGSYVSGNGDAGNPGAYYCSQTGDANSDQTVDLDDLDLVLANFGQQSSVGDLDCNGTVNLDDLDIVLANFGQSCN